MAKATKRSGCAATELGELLVLQLDQLFGDVAVGVIPERIDADRLHVDALLVHGLEALGADHEIGRPPLAVQHRHDLGEHAVRVDVDGLDAAAADHDLAAASRRLGVDVRRVKQAAAAEHGAGERAR